MESKRDQAEFDVKKRQIKELESLADRGYLDLFYYDESHFNLTPNIPYAWQKKGQTIKLPCAKSKSINVAGFYSKDNEFFSYQFRETINTDKLIEVFEDFIKETRKKTVIIIDNAPIHKSKKFMSCLPKWAEHWDVHLFFLPPYSPELNLIEILWRKMKYEWLEWHAYLDFERLQQGLNYVCKNVGSKFNIKFV